MIGTETRRRDGDRGTVVVEAAMVAPAFFLLLLALFEYALIFKDKMSVNNAVNDAARRGATNGNDAFADFEVLKSSRNALSALDRSVTRVIIFRAANRDDEVPPACLAVTPSSTPAGVVGVCNVYDASAFSANRIRFGYDATYRADPSLLDKHWAPSTRVSSAAAPFFIGVYVEATHADLTGILPADVVMKATVVMPFEARGS